MNRMTQVPAGKKAPLIDHNPKQQRHGRANILKTSSPTKARKSWSRSNKTRGGAVYLDSQTLSSSKMTGDRVNLKVLRWPVYYRLDRARQKCGSGEVYRGKTGYRTDINHL